MNYKVIFVLSIVFVIAAVIVINRTHSAASNFADAPGVAIASSKTAYSPTPTVVKGEKTVVLAGGCFWGVEAVFEHVTGVTNVVSGYSGGTAQTAQYEIVSGGKTGHAEAVKITFDPSQISYSQLLKVFLSVAHDPTMLNRQGPDTGTQYRSAIFYSDEEQQRLAHNYIGELNKSQAFRQPIVTQIVPLDSFYPAEDYHQDYLKHHPDNSYIIVNDQPKIENLRRQFPELYTP